MRELQRCGGGFHVWRHDGCWRVALGSWDLLGQAGLLSAGPQPPLHLPRHVQGPWAGVGAGHFSLEQAEETGRWAVLWP